MHRYRIFGFETCPFQPLQRHRPLETIYSQYRDYIDMEAMIAKPATWADDTTSITSDSEDWKVESSADEITAVLGEISSSDEEEEAIFVKTGTSEDEDNEQTVSLPEKSTTVDPKPLPGTPKKNRPPRRSSKTPAKRKSNVPSDMEKIMEKEMENVRKSKELQVIEKMQKMKAEKRRKEEEQRRREEAMVRRRNEQESNKTQIPAATVPAVPTMKRKSSGLMSRLKPKQPRVSKKAPTVNLKGLTPIVVPPTVTSPASQQSPSESQPISTSPSNKSLGLSHDSGIMCNSTASSSTMMSTSVASIPDEERIPLISVEPVRPNRTQLILKIKLGSNPQSELKYDFETSKPRKCSKCRKLPREEESKNGIDCPSCEKFYHRECCGLEHDVSGIPDGWVCKSCSRKKSTKSAK